MRLIYGACRVFSTGPFFLRLRRSSAVPSSRESSVGSWEGTVVRAESRFHSGAPQGALRQTPIPWREPRVQAADSWAPQCEWDAGATT
jgi:hypothetical protein